VNQVVPLPGKNLDATSPTGARVAIGLDEVSKLFGHGADAVAALDRISIEVPSGQFACIVGASGCGKSTLLSLIAGLDAPTSGRVQVDGGRPALMFQEPALLPWLTVARNVELPLRLRRVARVEREWEVQRLLRLVNLEQFAGKRPHELSGGMRQRVAMARALAQSSDVLLLDEPFGALDAITRDVLHKDLTRIWRETGSTIVFVTHNVREAVRLGDRVILLKPRPGRIARQWSVDIARPRRIEMQEVSALADEITEHLREEIRTHGRN
jgi:NitT/TauT family transport system ATP-binding protein